MGTLLGVHPIVPWPTGAESLAPGVVYSGGHRASLCDGLGGAKNQFFGEAREKVWRSSEGVTLQRGVDP